MAGKRARPERETASLAALLSQALVAYTIELDNAFEQRMPHRTTSFGVSDLSFVGVGPIPWLVSAAMYANCLQFVAERPVTVDSIEALTRTHTNLDGMRRWGYLTIDGHYKAPSPRHKCLLQATRAGMRAREVWQPLFAEVEDRWKARFGEDAVARLRASLQAIDGALDVSLPDYLPILGYGLLTERLHAEPAATAPAEPAATHGTLYALLSRALMAFALDFESASRMSLAISANLLRLLTAEGLPIRELPLLSGVSREAIDMAMGILQKFGLVEIRKQKAPASKWVGLTDRGVWAQATYHATLRSTEDRWSEKFGPLAVRGLHDALTPIVGDGTEDSPLFLGLEPPPGSWRARVRRPATLPHYPMVLHRGGFPDGS